MIVRRILSEAVLFILLGSALYADELVWSDEFDGSTLDLQKWDKPEYNRRPNKNGPDGWWLREDSFLDGQGHLVILARQIPDRNGDGDPYDYSTGAIRTIGKFEQLYGRFEIRCRLPQQPGWWAAFWLYTPGVLNEDGSGEDGTEIDIFEGFGWTDRVQHALHWDGYGDQHQTTSASFTMEDIRNGFHTFALEWYEDLYIFFIDGIESWRTTDGGVSKVPEYVKVTAELSTEDWAIGTGWANDPRKAVFPDTFLVDYVRVYRLDSAAAARPDPRAHLAYRKAVAASSTLSIAYHARRGVDGNISTRWASLPGAPHWYRVDLGAAYAVDKVVINWAKQFGTSYRIEVADQPDGLWKECITITDQASSGLVTHEFPAQIGRYVRLYGLASVDDGGFSFYELAVYGSPAAAIERRPTQPPVELAVVQNYPNPFNSSTLIRYVLPEEQEVRLTLYDLFGHPLETIAAGRQPAGEHTVEWPADDRPSGIYFCCLEAGGEKRVTKMILQR